LVGKYGASHFTVVFVPLVDTRTFLGGAVNRVSPVTTVVVALVVVGARVLVVAVAVVVGAAVVVGLAVVVGAAVVVGLAVVVGAAVVVGLAVVVGAAVVVGLAVVAAACSFNASSSARICASSSDSPLPPQPATTSARATTPVRILFTV
jgi:hypothetical protein